MVSSVFRIEIYDNYFDDMVDDNLILDYRTDSFDELLEVWEFLLPKFKGRMYRVSENGRTLIAGDYEEADRTDILENSWRQLGFYV